MADDYTPLLSDVREYVAAVKVFTEDEFNRALTVHDAELRAQIAADIRAHQREPSDYPVEVTLEKAARIAEGKL